MRIISIICSLIVFLFSTACMETVIVGSATTGFVVVREKSLPNTSKDIVISTKIGSSFLVNGLKNYGNSIDVTVNEGRVLLTGIVRDVQKAKLASDLCWSVKGVKEVIDEIQVRDGDSVHLKD
ncbi:MAG: BON domain-containing protein, partial [Pelagibacterales bacterium]|nr:BON domain-containing protein [Pelagibacterales bacterium]